MDYHQLDDKGKTSLKVIGDHSRAVTQLISDGVTASNLGRGYILRRLLRRVVRHGRLLGIDKPFLQAMGEASIALMQSAHPQLLERRGGDPGGTATGGSTLPGDVGTRREVAR